MTVTSLLPNTGPTVPVSRRPSPRSTSTSSVRGSPWRSCSAAWCRGRTLSITSVRVRPPSAPGGSSPRRRSAAMLLCGWSPASTPASNRSPTCHLARPSSSMGIASRISSASRGALTSSRARRKPRTGWLKKLWSAVSSTSSRGGAGNGPGRNRSAGRRSPRAASAPARAAASKLNGRSAPFTSSPAIRLRSSNGCSGCRTSTVSRNAVAVVVSTASSSSPNGTAGGRSAPVCSLAPV